jgi:hypothetical protein
MAIGQARLPVEKMNHVVALLCLVMATLDGASSGSYSALAVRIMKQKK